MACETSRKNDEPHTPAPVFNERPHRAGGAWTQRAVSGSSSTVAQSCRRARASGHGACSLAHSEANLFEPIRPRATRGVRERAALPSAPSPVRQRRGARVRGQGQGWGGERAHSSGCTSGPSHTYLSRSPQRAFNRGNFWFRDTRHEKAESINAQSTTATVITRPQP